MRCGHEQRDVDRVSIRLLAGALIVTPANGMRSQGFQP
jgi:hypothetical protein